MIIRPEGAADHDAIHQVISAAFKDVLHSDQSEPVLVHCLREKGGLSLSLVAEDTTGAIIGHIAFSKVLIDGEDQGWFGLAPVSVVPTNQNQGVGSALIKEGLSLLEKDGAMGCALLGEPDYYRRFGFESETGLRLKNVPQEFFMARLIKAISFPEGTVTYHAAFGL